MHKDHRLFSGPATTNMRIWRYMDLSKLVSLLHTSTLWFARADTMSDPYEGAYGAHNLPAEVDTSIIPASEWPKIKENAQHCARYTFVNCWHMADAESLAMWGSYATKGQAVVAQSTFERLTRSITDERSVYAGTVTYVNRREDWISGVAGNTFWPILFKRPSFSYEHELRAVTQQWKTRDGVVVYDVEPPPGLSVSVELGTLLEAVYVGPGEPERFRQAVTAVVEAFAPGTPVHQSALDVGPAF